MEEKPLNMYRLRRKILEHAKKLCDKYKVEEISDSFLIELIDATIMETHKNVDRIILENMKEKLEKLILE